MTANFTNILQALFSNQILCTPFMCLQLGFVIFWRKDFGAKAAHKMLVKLTPGGRIWQVNAPHCATLSKFKYRTKKLLEG
jgi:hypothetical protein